MKYIKYLGLIFCLLTATNVMAIAVTDRWPNDDNIITGVTEDAANKTLTIYEDYNEDERIPYPSHDGFAIVEYEVGQPVQWFDKIFDLNGADGRWQFQFEVTNTTPWDWSDYHFVFFNGSDFQVPLEVKLSQILLGWGNNVVFQNSNLTGNELQFWAPDWHLAGQTRDYVLALDLDNLPRGVNTIGIRQIATTVPVIGTMPLILLGALSFMWSLKKRR